MDINFSDPLDDFGSVFGSFNMPSFYYPTIFHTGPPLPYFLSDQTSDDAGLSYTGNTPGASSGHLDTSNGGLQNPNSLSWVDSQLPSSHPELVPTSIGHRLTKPYSLCNVTVEDRQHLLARMESFNSVISTGFVLPSRDTLSRYLAGYVNGFHDHLPFLHIPTVEIENASLELILAIAAVGGQYCFEGVKAGELFTVSKAVVLERMRRTGVLRSGSLNQTEGQRKTSEMLPTAAQGSPEDVVGEFDTSETTDVSNPYFKSIETSQTLTSSPGYGNLEW